MISIWFNIDPPVWGALESQLATERRQVTLKRTGDRNTQFQMNQRVTLNFEGVTEH